MKLAFHSYRVSLAIWDHTVFPATWHKWTQPALTPAIGRYLIYLPQRDGRLSWPRWQVTYRDGLPTYKQFSRLKVKGLDIYIPPLTGKPWPAAVYNSKWCTDRQALTRQCTAGSIQRTAIL